MTSKKVSANTLSSTINAKKKQSKVNSKHSESDLPLLDEVNELIDKERSLLTLKVLEQQTEASEWRSKYDQLLQQIRSNRDVNEIPLAEGISSGPASNETNNKNNTHLYDIRTERDINHLLLNPQHAWILNLCNTTISPEAFAKLCKLTFGTKSVYNEYRSIQLSNSGLTDDYSNALCGILRNPRMQAIDLSKNSLSEVFFAQLLGVLSVSAVVVVVVVERLFSLLSVIE